MLEAERNALAVEAYHNSLNIVERELQIYLNDLSMVGTQAALLAGFSIGFMGEAVGVSQDANVAFEAVFTGMVALTFGLMMYVVGCALVLYSLAPSLALRGSSGSSMRAAVEKIKRDLTSTKRAFGFGSTAFFAVIIMKAWDEAHLATAIISTLVLLICFGMLVRSIRAMNASYAMHLPGSGGGSDSSSKGAGYLKGIEFLRRAEVVSPSGAQIDLPFASPKGAASSGTL